MALPTLLREQGTRLHELLKENQVRTWALHGWRGWRGRQIRAGTYAAPWRRRRLGAWGQEGGQIRSSGTGTSRDPVVRIPEFHYHGLGSIPVGELEILTKKREKKQQ